LSDPIFLVGASASSMALAVPHAFWLFSGWLQKSGSEICFPVLLAGVLAGASKIAPHGESLLAERGVFTFQFVDGHIARSYLF